MMILPPQAETLGTSGIISSFYGYDGGIVGWWYLCW